MQVICTAALLRCLPHSKVLKRCTSIEAKLGTL